MRRKSDSYLNATQILKVAGFDKPQRTRVLEREVQKGEHEKIQGGYGKYQGTSCLMLSCRKCWEVGKLGERSSFEHWRRGHPYPNDRKIPRPLLLVVYESLMMQARGSRSNEVWRYQSSTV